MKFDRVYHPVYLWEEIPANMWGSVQSKKEAIQKAIEFTGDHNLYGSYMMKVVELWPVSCENALTDYQLNRKAWIGHAAVAMAIGIPENITREAWGKLRDEQRILANKEAERAIRTWELSYAKSKGLHIDMGKSLLF